MKITNIGGATAIFEHEGKRMLLDPWLNEGILYGSWHHFPPLRIGIDEIGRFDYIYISHIHEDHCAPGTIKHLNRDAEIIVMDREPDIPNYITRFLRTYDFRFRKVHLVKPHTPQEIAPGLVVDMVEADPVHTYNYLIDSGLILNWGGLTIYDANDCAPYPRGIDYLKTKYGKVDLALLPYSGGSGYPGCYSNLSHDNKMREKSRIFEQAMNHFVETVRTLDPVLVMPFADQYVIAGSRYLLNQYSPHPPCPGWCAEPLRKAGLADKLLLLNSAQSFDTETRRKTPEDAYHLFSGEDRVRYARSLSDKKYAHEEVAFSPNVPVKRLLAAARQRLWDVQQEENWFPDYHLYIDAPDRNQRFAISMAAHGVAEHRLDAAPPLQQPFLRMSMSSTLLIMMLINHVSWNMADGSLFIDYERVPNIYDPKFYAYLNHLIV
jgi:UDP-MurNAc hydroxylase